MPCQSTGLFWAAFSPVLQLLTPVDSVQEVPWIPSGNPAPHHDGSIHKAQSGQTSHASPLFALSADVHFLKQWIQIFWLFSLLRVHPGQKEIWFLSVCLGHKQESNSILNSSSQ